MLRCTKNNPKGMQCNLFIIHALWQGNDFVRTHQIQFMLRKCARSWIKNMSFQILQIYRIIGYFKITKLFDYLVAYRCIYNNNRKILN